MFEVRDYIVMESTDALGQPLLELWVDYLPGVDGMEPHDLQAVRHDNALDFPHLSRRITGLSAEAWRMIELTRDGAIVVCGPSGVIWRSLWRLGAHSTC